MSDHSNGKARASSMFAAGVAVVLALTSACTPDPSLVSHKQAVSSAKLASAGKQASSSAVAKATRQAASSTMSKSKVGSVTSTSHGAHTVTAAAHTASKAKATMTKSATTARHTPKGKHQVKAPTTTPTVHNLMIPRPGTAYLGVSSSSSTASGITGLEARLHRHFDIDNNFWSFTTPDGLSNISSSVLADDKQNTRMPLVTWQPQLHGSSKDIMSDIAAGKYDVYIRHVAVQLRSFHDPVMLRFAHEMNGDWYSWSGCMGGCTPNGATDYVAAWQHVWNIFHDAHARNVLWVWCTASEDSGGYHWTKYYPGDRYVDWVSVDHYIHPNGAIKGTGPDGAVTAKDVVASWAGTEKRGMFDSFATSKETVYNDYNLVNGTLARKPFIVSETAVGPMLNADVDRLINSGQLDTSGFDKSYYYGSANPGVVRYPGIKAVVLFDHYTGATYSNAHDYCLDEQHCHPQKWQGKVQPAPNASSSHRNFMAFYSDMGRSCTFDPHMRMGKCHN